jgi:hypothetical protein
MTWRMKVLVWVYQEVNYELKISWWNILSLRARSCVYHIDFYTIPYIQAHIFGVGSANARKRHHPTPERISSCTRSLCTWWALNGKYLYILSIWFNIIALTPIWWYLFWFDFFQLDEMMNLWICQMRWWICEGLTLSGCWPHTSSIWPWLGAPKVRL